MNLDDSRNDDNLSKIIFITGGTKSGKSEFAEYLAEKREKLFNRAAAVATKQTRSTLMMRSLAKKSIQTFNAKRSTANKVK